MDSHCQHVESAQQCRGGCAGRHAVCRRRERRHQLPELYGAVQSQDQHLGRSGPHEHTQVSVQGQVFWLLDDETQVKTHPLMMWQFFEATLIHERVKVIMSFAVRTV